MITQWDIISSIRSKDNAILYALLIDGTEHDARLIAKKLQGYVGAPQPALAPYVYRFPLPDDMDENTVEKIRVAVREGIEQAKKVNEFVPGGPLGNPLFNADVTKEDKAFPTFITLDPSESFFRAARHTDAVPPPPAPDVNGFEQRQIDLSQSEEETAQAAQTLEEIDNAGYRSDPAGAPTAPDITEKPQAKKDNFISFKRKPSAEVAPQPGAPAQSVAPAKPEAPSVEDLPMPQEEPAPEEVLTSVESDEFWSDQPPASELKDISQPQDQQQDIQLEVQAVESQSLPEEMTPAMAPAETSQPQQSADAASNEDLPVNDRDMLIKDMEGTMLDQSLDDIFLAETKYDMFVDVEKLAPSAKGKQAAAQPTANIPPASAENAGQEEDTNSFNIFDQKIKDQTNFIDLEDIKGITERITQKDLSFLQHAQVTAQKQAAAQDSAPQPIPAENIDLDKTRAYMPLPSAFGRIDSAAEDEQEALDPFEQMLAASRAPKEPAPQQPLPQQASHQEPEQTPPQADLTEQTPQPAAEENAFPAAPADAPADTGSAQPAAPQQPANTLEEPIEKTDRLQAVSAEESLKESPAVAPTQTPRENRVVPPSMPITEKKMPENQGEKKPVFRIKRKSQTPGADITQHPASAPHVPPTPAAAPHTPAATPAPQIPSAAPTPTPVPPTASAPQAPAPAPQMPAAAAPQEEKHGATILRRRRPANTFLEKTRTIDHSIELPLSELKKHNWPLEVPLVPTYTLENMTISVNRFAHATAISVIDNPGKLYNPLVLHGTSGTGKTHFLHAIGYALSNKYGQENIFITNGVRLSRGIQRYVMEGNMDKFESFTDSVKALLIDDIHLIAINEQNRAHLSKLLNDFRKQHKQIVVTSKYPPESLAKLEELLDFKLDSGWISDLKQASGSARTRIIQKMLNSNGINIANEDIDRFFGHSNMSLGTVARAIRRVRVLEKIIFPNEAPEKRSTKAIFDQLLATAGEDTTSLIAQKTPAQVNSAPVSGNGEWGRIGFFYPQNHSNMMNWLVFALQQRAKELGIPGGPELAVRSSYSTENIISSAFKIANLCDNKKLKGAVILGPETETCDPSVRENFYDILTHMLEIMLIRCGVINYENVSAPSTYVKILSELLR